MLTEFALTPSIFDEALHPATDVWQEQLMELGRNIFPRVAASPVIMSNLHGGVWYGEAAKVIARVRNPRIRKLCQDLYTKVADILVSRPQRGVQPGTELQWAQAALAFERDEPVDRVIVTKPTKDCGTLCSDSVYAIDEVQTDGFWEGVSADADPVMEVAPQVALLRKLCKHAGFLCLVSKDIRGADDDETQFAIALIRSAFDRPTGFALAEIEIHAQGPDLDPGSPSYPDRLKNVVSNLRQSVESGLRRGQQVRLVVWAKLLDRLLVAGSCTKNASGQRTRRPRWGVAMSHIARAGDKRRGTPPTHWHLLQKAALGQKFALYGAPNHPAQVHTEIIRGCPSTPAG